jgi:preprotein translocase subunit SecA
VLGADHWFPTAKARLPLPLPGAVWGSYPEQASDAPPPSFAISSRRRRYLRITTDARRHASEWRALPAPEWQQSLLVIRGELRRVGFEPQILAKALGVLIVACEASLGRTPYDCQLYAAAVLLDKRLAEVATGEGKTLAAALAAAIAGLAGVPVHVVTANDYLAERDAWAMAALFEYIGLSVAHVAPAMDREQRRAVYACNVVYCTAKELAFDALRDRLAMGPQRHALQRRAASLNGSSNPVEATVLRGLCMAILDEADSILLDEASVPLVLSRAVQHTARRAFMWQALAVARQLDRALHFTLAPKTRSVILTAAGRERLQVLTQSLGGPWRRPRYRDEVVLTALTALHLQQRDHHYLVREGGIEILDEVTGRVAPGKVWSRGLHTLVEMKENCKPSAETETVARTTFQRFFQRYVHLCGTSGTLTQARAELRQVYATDVVSVPLRVACRRLTFPMHLFVDHAALWQAVARRVAQMHALGRPVLVGTDSVAESEALSQHLRTAGIDHAVLNARHDRDEADIVARAGQTGRVTVATRMAGRGTDIHLDERARGAGGLHVIVCQRNPSRRLDRQLQGRAGRQGDLGSTETWIVAANAKRLHDAARTIGKRWGKCDVSPAFSRPQILLRLLAAWPQWAEERRLRALRRHLLEQDLQWEQRLSFAGDSA